MNTKGIIKSDNERRAYEVLNAIRNNEKSAPENEQRQLKESHAAGVEYMNSIFDDAQTYIPKALAVASYLIREAERRHAFDDMDNELLEVTHGEDPLVLIAKAEVIAAMFNTRVNERIKMSLYIAQELFDADSLNDPVESLTD